MILCKINGNLSVGMRLITTEASRRPLAILKPLMLVDMAENWSYAQNYTCWCHQFKIRKKKKKKKNIKSYPKDRLEGEEHAYECVLLMSCRHGI